MNEVNEEKRIYVVVPLQVTGTKGVVRQPIGRQAAQAVHVVSKMRVTSRQDTFAPVTTIILSARDAREMVHVWNLLKRKKIEVTHFADTNPDYGTGTNLVTAICTEPMYKHQVENVLDYLPLWPGDQK